MLFEKQKVLIPVGPAELLNSKLDNIKICEREADVTNDNIILHDTKEREHYMEVVGYFFTESEIKTVLNYFKNLSHAVTEEDMRTILSNKCDLMFFEEE